VSGASRFPADFCDVFLPSGPEKRAAVNADAQIARHDARFPKLAGDPSAQVPDPRLPEDRWHAATPDKTILHFRKPGPWLTAPWPMMEW
jgi:hypothetical protein